MTGSLLSKVIACPVISTLVTGALMLGALATTAGLSPAPAQAQSSDMYEIGYTADLTGVAASTYAPWAEGVRVYIEQLNAKGGIGGHKINLVLRDNKSDAATVAQDARFFVSDPKYSLVFFSATSATITPYLNAGGADLPTIYGNVCYPPSTPPSPKPNFFCAFGTREMLHKMFVDMIFQTAKGQPVKLGLMAADLPGTVQSTKIMGAHAEQQGATIALYQAVPLSTTDYSVVARQFINSGANVILNYNFTSQNVGLAQALVRLGYTGIYLTDASLPGSYEALARLKSPGIYGLDAYAPPTEKLDVHKDIAAAAKQQGSRYADSDLRVGWATGMAMTPALRACGFPCDRQKLSGIMSHLTVDDPMFQQLNGGPMVWSPDNHVGLVKSFMIDHYDAAKGGFAASTNWIKVEEKDLLNYDEIAVH
jgi:branched-chain amino acid transport system substrate-binding protein